MKERMRSDRGTINATDSGDDVILRRELRHPIDVVWAALTEPDQLAVWLMETSVLELRVGGAIGFNEEGMGPPGTITELTPPSVLEYTRTTGHEPPHSTVRFKLTEAAGSTTLTLTHSRNPSGTTVLDHAAGWQAHLDWLSAQLDEQPLPDFWNLFHELRPEYAEIHPSGI